VTSRGAHVLVVGAGGLGAPVLRLLARAPGIHALTFVDDDVVERSNLHRQTLFDEADVGAPKVARAVARLRALAEAAGSRVTLNGVEARFTPDDALARLEGVTLVVEGADNFATKFLVADACARARIPLVQAGCVRWAGWAYASVPGESACLRCVFEDIPARLAARTGQVAPPETCAEAGVVGPVVGVLGALEAVLALRLVAGDARAAGVLWRYDGARGTVRRSRVRRRAGCPLCEGVVPSLAMDDYTAPACA
jgi:molybdopterin/thiamine biosynthesis adenylyltransferase